MNNQPMYQTLQNEKKSAKVKIHQSVKYSPKYVKQCHAYKTGSLTMHTEMVVYQYMQKW